MIYTQKKSPYKTSINKKKKKNPWNIKYIGHPKTNSTITPEKLSSLPNEECDIS